MVATQSTMEELGRKAPEFNLPDLDGNLVSLDTFSQSKGYLVMFICNHCPFVVHVMETLSEVCRKFEQQGVAVVAINSNDIEKYPADHPDKMRGFAKEYKLSFPYLFDESQEVAKAYKAACTPDFFLFDANKQLVYRGQLDSSRPGNDEVNDGQDLKSAVDALINGSEPLGYQTPSIGCNIKWRPGNEPTYFG